MDSFQKNNMLSQNSSSDAGKKQSTGNSSSNAKKKQSTGNSSSDAKKKQSTDNSTNSHCHNNNLELIVAILLLTGKLRVDAVQLFRQATMIVSLTGKYITLGDLNNKNVDNMLKVLNDNGNMTVDEIIQTLKKENG
ncbi:hypothetical protein [Brevibacillus laterosporus]|uniref:hypothetical protein n=1 Tax=Brevibacillus laterosporus TaxID=1465 RepID=UPI003D1AC31E